MTLKKIKYGRLENGCKVTKYVLSNEKIQVGILSYGGIVDEILVPDKNGNFENVVLGFEKLEDYIEKSPYFGCIVGRVAGRIKGGEFKLNGTVYPLEKNENQNTIHGGINNLSKKNWKVEEIENGIVLNYTSPHLEGGFPAEVEFKVSYIIEESSLIVKYEARPDQDTILNLTNHTYFNLAGNLKSNVLDHSLKIDADYFLHLDKESIPTGKFEDVENTPFDFRKEKKIGKELFCGNSQIEIVGWGYDHPFVLRQGHKPEIVLHEEKSGRILEVSTSEKSVIVYTGNQLGNEGVLKDGVLSRKYLGVCLETQDFPNCINEDNFEDIVYNKNNIYTSETRYKFSIQG
jgi:aldose 1-epimerase